MSGQFEDQYHYNGTSYSIIRREPRKCFDPKECGLSPDGSCCSACWDGYYCDFAILDNRLLLQNLYVQTTDDYYPTIAGVAVQGPDRPWEFPVYRNLYIPIPWTGRLLAGDGFIKEHYAHLGYQRIWAYQIIKEFTFKDGNLIEVNDLSELGEQLRPLAPKRDFYGLWDYEKAAPMEQYRNAWWAE